MRQAISTVTAGTIVWACAAFGNSLQPISLVALLQQPFILLALDSIFHGQNTVQMKTCNVLLLFLFQALGATFAFSGTFGYPHTNFESIATAFGFSIALVAAFAVFGYLSYERSTQLCPNCWYTALSFPCMFTGATSIVGLFTSSFPVLGNSLLDYTPLVQFSSLLGLAGINFLASLLSTAIFLRHASPNSSARPKAPTQLDQLTSHVTVIVVLLLTAARGLSYSDSFYQKDITTQIKPVITASCVVGQNAQPSSKQLETLFSHTAARVAAGDEVVLWSEEAANVLSEEQEQDLLKRVALLSENTNKTYIGVSYLKLVKDDQGRFDNIFILYAPGGGLAWKYLKAFPVPVVEADIRAGPAVLPICDAPFGRLSGAICFDMDHPQYIRQAGVNGVNIMLQPSWTWGDIGPRHFTGNALRAVENGFTLVRCSSMGVSGVVSPRGVVWHQTYTAAEGMYTWTVPVEKHVRTLYVAAGFAFEWINLFIACLLWLWLAIPMSVWQRAVHGMQAIRNHVCHQNELGYERIDTESTPLNPEENQIPCLPGRAQCVY